ncbi:MAG: 30S ribosomal protein S20 [Anaerolineaceae bacterium]|nr:30S ribosomal protein S20 [Anaerolineaceae bacterium]
MANIKSAIKRNKQNEKRRIRNRIVRGRTRASMKEARIEIQKADVESAEVAVIKAISSLDKAAAKGVLHKNNASRRKSRLMKRLAALKQQA